jgi:hypothetical protein
MKYQIEERSSIIEISSEHGISQNLNLRTEAQQIYQQF